MTEDEAKAKACCGPPTVASATLMASTRKDMHAEAMDGMKWGHCIGSLCMAWRWKYEQTNKDRLHSMSWPPVDPVYRQTEHGYCGLAGGSQ